MPAPNLDDLDQQISDTRKAFFEARHRLIQLAHPRNTDPEAAIDELIATSAEMGLAHTLDSALREPVLHGLADLTPADQLTNNLGAAYAADQALDLLIRDKNVELKRYDPSRTPRMNHFGHEVELDLRANLARDVDSSETFSLPNHERDLLKRRRREKSK